MMKKTYPEEFFKWLEDNSEITNQLLPTSPSYLKKYISDQTPILERESLGDVIWWDVGRYQKFEEMSYEEKELYLEDCMSKLWEEYCDQDRDIKEKLQEFRVLILDSQIRGSFGQLLGYFIGSTEDTKVITFKELERIIGVSLPSAAYRFKDWWLNPNHIYSESWSRVGWRATEVKLGEYVRFISE